MRRSSPSLRRNNLSLHFDDQWHTVFVDCICPPAIDGLREVSLEDLIEKNLFGEGSALLCAGSGQIPLFFQETPTSGHT